ncbi:MAG: hypothetical protein EA370_04410 [Wenzhouxiangella sp.]|nr:MAG: hypothetical protein EA370_04410 [Wenzhouxiangella sp.]
MNTGFTLRALISLRTGRSGWTRLTLRAFQALRPLLTLNSRFTLRTLLSLRARWTRISLRPRRAFVASQRKHRQRGGTQSLARIHGQAFNANLKVERLISESGGTEIQLDLEQAILDRPVRTRNHQSNLGTVGQRIVEPELQVCAAGKRGPGLVQLALVGDGSILRPS